MEKREEVAKKGWRMSMRVRRWPRKWRKRRRRSEKKVTTKRGKAMKSERKEARRKGEVRRR